MLSTSPPVQQQEDDVQIEEEEDDESEPTEVLSQSKDDQSTAQGQTTPRSVSMCHQYSHAGVGFLIFENNPPFSSNTRV